MDANEPAALRPFTDDDRKLYPCTETKAPEIARLEWGDIVLDGEVVRAWAEDLNAGRATRWQGCFFKAAVARLVAEALVALDDPEALPRFLDQEA